eukprot:TRINITY_DN30885_c0_g1_i1.p1 TRINITY_DN30885_c0_g1~~TRINITY_DN30885_c0_g1_i1.p1  ORF type:complete len:517 (+),score=108.30 TRINITY_DN30885_c0_g1_i1:183-1733(+)
MAVSVIVAFALTRTAVAIAQLRLGSRFEGGKGATPEFVMVDAGSSGSKLFGYSSERGSEKRSAKVLTFCEDRSDMTPSENSLHGLAALSYSADTCTLVAVPPNDTRRVLHSPLDFAPLLLKSLFKLVTGSDAEAQAPEKLLGRVENRARVPILATAGMRLLSQSVNEKVWGLVCNRSTAGFSFAHRGSMCGTIPGTEEAYFDFLANAMSDSGSSPPSGTFTMGGASAQIAIPLMTERDAADFRSMRSAVLEELNCSTLRLADGSAAPVFRPQSGLSPDKACIEDYLSFKPRSEIQAPVGRSTDIVGLGLISFLGLGGSGSFVAGGVDTMAHWAEKENCSSPSMNFFACVAKLQDALSNDMMWKHVTRFFRDKGFDIASFSYNSWAALPENVGLPVGHGSDQAWTLGRLVELHCSGGGALPASLGERGCMAAFYVSLYTTAFFSPPADLGGQSPNASPELRKNDKVDWSDGFAGQGLLSLLDTTAGLGALLMTPLRSHSADFAEGFRIHMQSSGYDS